MSLDIYFILMIWQKKYKSGDTHKHHKTYVSKCYSYIKINDTF